MKMKILSSLMLACAFLMSPVMATEINVSKLRVDLDHGKTSEFLTLNNQSETEKQAYEVSLFKWTQKPNPEYEKNKKAPELLEVLTPTEDILASPKTIVLLPKQNKIIRLIINNAENAKKDYSYRLIINQLPNKELEAKVNTISLLFKVSLPVFVYDNLIDNVNNLNMNKSIVNENGKQYLVLTNNDKQHLQIQSLNFDSNKLPLNKYLLPGNTEKLELPENYKANSKTPLVVVTDKGNFNITQ